MISFQTHTKLFLRGQALETRGVERSERILYIHVYSEKKENVEKAVQKVSGLLYHFYYTYKCIVMLQALCTISIKIHTVNVSKSVIFFWRLVFICRLVCLDVGLEIGFAAI